MAIGLQTYKNFKGVIKDICKVNKFFVDTFPTKSWGWIGLTALLYSMKAMELYLQGSTPQKDYYNAMKSVLWNYQNLMNEYQIKRGG